MNINMKWAYYIKYIFTEISTEFLWSSVKKMGHVVQ